MIVSSKTRRTRENQSGNVLRKKLYVLKEKIVLRVDDVESVRREETLERVARRIDMSSLLHLCSQQGQLVAILDVTLPPSTRRPRHSRGSSKASPLGQMLVVHGIRA